MMRPRFHRAPLAILLLAAAACGSKGGKTWSGRPEPSPVGRPLGKLVTSAIGASGGTLVSDDGQLTVVIPAGAVAAPVDFTVEEITNTAPGGQGNAYRIGPAGTLLAVPATLTFKASYPGTTLDSLTIATQDAVGYWLKPEAVTRDAVAQTVATSTSHFSDWALVTGTTALDLHGTFHLATTVGTPFSAVGDATLNHAGEDADRNYYLQWGTLTLTTPVTIGGATCDTAAPVSDLVTNIAEITKVAPKLSWGVSGHWSLTCSNATSQLLTLAFDTFGLSNLGCTRTPGPAIMGPDRVQGTYFIDCGTAGSVTADWDFYTPICGTPCTTQQDTACHVGVNDCSTGTATCVNGGNQPDGTVCNDGNACTGTDTCQAGVCTGASPVVCAPLDQCHDAGVCDPASGVCSNPAKPNGTACNDASVCTQTDTCQAGVCTGSSPVVCTALDQCHDAGICDPVAGCSNPAKPDGTACNDGSACTPTEACQAGVCTATSGIVCTALDQCHDVGVCDAGTGTCSNPAKADGSTCSDGNACTQTDSCQTGACVGSNPVVCTALDECHDVGTCAPASGVCSNPNKPDGTPCGGGSLTCLAGSCGARTVSGQRKVTYWPDAGAQAPAVPGDVLASSVDAWVPDGSGGLTRIQGTLALDGSYSIPNVPSGSYLLAVTDGSGRVSAVETTSSSPDLGFDVLGHSGTSLATLPTDVTVSVSGLTAWDPAGDQIQLTSGDADVWDPAVQGAQLAAAPGGDVHEDWSASAAGGPLALIGTGDLLWVHHLGQQATGGTPATYRNAVEATFRSDVALADGVAATIGAAFPGLQPVTQSGSFSLTQWNVPSFEALLADMGPSATASGSALHVAASAHALVSPAPVSRNGSPDLLLLQLPPGSAAVGALGPLAYGRFLPAAPAWNEWRGVDFTALQAYTAPGATTGLVERATAGRREAMDASAATFSATLGPVTSVRVGTALASTNPAGVGTTPTLSWIKSAVGTPSSYLVEIFWLHEQGGASVGTKVATLVTGNAQVTVPGGVLSAGNTYYARITARADTPDAFGTAPFRRANVGTWASALTGTFSP